MWRPSQFLLDERLANLFLGWYFNNVHNWKYSISYQEGRFVQLNLRYSDPVLGGRFHTTEVRAAWQEYLTMPWARLHVLALLWSGGVGIGDKRDFFYLGGFYEQDVLKAVFLNRPQCCTFAVSSKKLKPQRTQSYIEISLCPVWRSC